jgi:zinc transporter ZupT
MATDGTYLHSIAAAGILAVVHVGASRLRLLQAQPRSVWLSAGGGIAVAYVFMHLLPELSEHQGVLAASAPAGLSGLEQHVYLVALLGLGVFYGLENLTLKDRRRRTRPDGRAGDVTTGAGTFWLSITTFGIYNALIGYLLMEQLRTGASNLYLFTAAMGLHFLVNDFGLQQHHRERYRRLGRWILAAAVLAGSAVAPWLQVPRPLVSVVVAFLAGGLILNVMKEELPTERESRYAAFALGAAGYAALLILLG